MAVSSSITLTQFVTDDHYGYFSGLPGSESCSFLLLGLAGTIDGEYPSLIPLLAIQNPRPKSGLQTTYYVTSDPDDWSDSPVNAPGLSDSLRFAYGRYGSRYRNLDRYVGAVIHQRSYARDSDFQVESFITSSDGYYMGLAGSVEGDDVLYGSEQPYGTADVKQYNFLVSAHPSPYSYNNSVTTDVWIKLSNYTYTLNSGTVSLYLDGVSVSPITVTPYSEGIGGITAHWQNNIQFDYDTQVDVRWVVYDEAPTPNKITFDYWFRTIADVTGPRVYESYPQDNDTDVSISTCISFDIRDYETGVDINTLELYVNNVYIPLSDLTISALSSLDGYTVSYCPGEKFLYGDFISVSIKVADFADPKNYIFHAYNFTTVESNTPRVILSDPLPCRDYVLLNKDVSVFVVDGGNGLDEESIRFSVNDYLVEYRLLPILYREE